MPAAELDATEARPVAAAVLEQADEISVQASRAVAVRSGRSSGPQPGQGRNQPMSNPVTGDPTPAVATDRIAVVAREAGLSLEQTQVFRVVSESMAAGGWELTEAELRAGAELAAGRADHITVHDDPDQLIDDPRNRDLLAPAGLDVDAAGTAADEVISRARTAVAVLTAHRQQIQHRETERARDEELSRWHTYDHATDRHAATEIDGPSPAGAAW